MRVWIDQDLCTGDGLCTEICPTVFEMHDDGLAYVKEVEWPSILGEDKEPRYQGATGLASVPGELEEVVQEAADECPGECIMIEHD